MKPIKNATVLITGGSKGIGFAIAEEFAKNNHDVILVARHQNELDRAAKRISSQHPVDITVIPIDLSAPQAPERLFKQLDNEDIKVDILVNNAGAGMTGNFAKSNESQMINMLQLNMITLTHLTHLFIQPMLERKQGRILKIGSLVSYFTGAPNWASYVASKHYVRAFTKGLSRELKNTGVTATLISPGATATDFASTADATTMRVYKTPINVSPADIAKLAYKSCQAGKQSATSGLLNKILAFLGELPPRSIAFEVFAFLSQKVTKAPREL